MVTMLGDGMGTTETQADGLCPREHCSVGEETVQFSVFDRVTEEQALESGVSGSPFSFIFQRALNIAIFIYCKEIWMQMNLKEAPTIQPYKRFYYIHSHFFFLRQFQEL